MIDEEYSKAVRSFVGIAGRLDPVPPEDRVTASCGDAAAVLLPRIHAMLEAMNTAEPSLWNHSDLAEVGRRADGWLRAHHPELSEEAVRAVVNQFSYEWR